MAIWTVTNPTPDEILNRLDGARTREEAKDRLLRLGLDEQQAHDALDIINAAAGRSVLLSTGLHRDQFYGDFEDDPLFISALNRSGYDTARQTGPIPRPRISLLSCAVIVVICLVLLVGVIVFLSTIRVR